MSTIGNKASHSGEINVPITNGIITKKHVWGTICEIVAGLKPGRSSAEEITVFTSTVFAVKEAVAANLAYKKALTNRFGNIFEIV